MSPLRRLFRVDGAREHLRSGGILIASFDFKGALRHCEVAKKGADGKIESLGFLDGRAYHRLLDSGEIVVERDDPARNTKVFRAKP